MNADQYLKNGKAYVWKETFSIIKSKRQHPRAFANIVDRNEITVIVDNNHIQKKEILEIQRDWKIITFDIVLPFGLVGFLAKVSKLLADEKIPIFVISGYSTDHLLVRKKDLPISIKKIKSLGCIVEGK